MSGGGGNTNTTTTSNAPPQEYLDAYKKITGQASGVAAAPYSPYPGQKLADFSPDQQAGIQGVRNAQGISDPYINAGAQYIDRATQPIWDNSTHPDAGMMAGIPGQSLGYLGQAAGPGITGAGDAGVAGIWNMTNKGVTGIDNYTAQGVGNINNYTGTGVSNILGATGTFNPNAIKQFEDPYTQSVVDAMGRDFQNQNDIQQQGIIGDAIGKGAWGGDRSAVAQGIIAGQQARAQDPIMANLRSQGFQQATQAAEEQGRQRITGTTNAGQLGVQGSTASGQLGVQGSTNSGQLGVQGANMAGTLGLNAQIADAAAKTAAAKTGLDFYGGQQGAELGAKQAEGWINMQGASGMGSLGNQALNNRLTGSNALLGVGGMEQGQAQAGLNIPYQEWQANQAYPFQTTGWLSNIVQGLGSASGGTGSTTSPGPSLASQYGGLATAGIGALGSTGAFGGESSDGGWLSNMWNGSVAPTVKPEARGGRIPNRAVGGGIIPRYAFGGPTSGIGPLDGTKPLDEESVVPEGIAGGGKGKIFGNFGQTATTSGGPQKDSEIGSLIKTAGLAAATFWGGPAGSAAGQAFNSQVHFDRGGGIVDDPMYRNVPRLDGGGSVSIMQSGHGGPGIPQLTGGGGGGAGSGIAPTGSVDDYLASQAKGRVALPPPPPPVAAATNGPAKTEPTNQWGIPDYAIPGPGGVGVATPKQAAYLMDPGYVQEFPGSNGDRGAVYNREGILVRQSDIPGQIMPYHLPGFAPPEAGSGGGEAFGGRIGREEGGDIPQEAPQAPAEPEQNVDIKIPDVGDATPSVNSTLGLPEGYTGGPTIPQGTGIIPAPQGQGPASAPGPHGPVPMQAGPGYVPPPPELVPVVQQAAAKYGVDPKQLAWLLSTESRWNPKAYNRLSGTMGIGQFKPGTAAEMQIDPWDPQQAIMGAAGYLRKMLDKNGGDYERAIGRYGTFSTGQGKEADEAVRQRYRAFMAQGQAAARGGGIVGLALGGWPSTDQPPDDGSPRMPSSNPFQPVSDPPGGSVLPALDNSVTSTVQPTPDTDLFTGLPGADNPTNPGASATPASRNPSIPASKGIVTQPDDGGGDTGAGIPPPPPAPPQAGDAGKKDDEKDEPKVSGWQKLMNVGLGIMSGTSPHALVNVGAGALKGIAMSDKEQQTMEAAATRRDVAKTNALYREGLLKNAGRGLDIKQGDLDRKVRLDAVRAEYLAWKQSHGDATLAQGNAKLDELARNHDMQNDRGIMRLDQNGKWIDARIEQGDQRLQQGDRRLDQGDTKIEQTNRRLDQADARILDNREFKTLARADRLAQVQNTQDYRAEEQRLKSISKDQNRINAIMSAASRAWAQNPAEPLSTFVEQATREYEKNIQRSPTSAPRPATTQSQTAYPPWARPGDQYNAKTGKARTPGGYVYDATHPLPPGTP